MVPASRPAVRGTDRRNRFSLLIVRGDGVRVATLSFPRRLPIAVACAAVVAASAVTVLAGDWWHVRHRMRDSAALLGQIDEQEAALKSFHRRVADISKEVGSWRDVHARLAEPFGPEAGRGRESGIGGRTSPVDRPAGKSPAEDLDRLAEQVAAEGESLRALDRVISRARRALAMLPSRWPVRGPVNSEFGKRPSPWTRTTEFHEGLDIGAPSGTPVKAPAAGTVVAAGPHGDFGLAVILDHGHDLRTIYGHLSRVLVRQGQHVERGADLGFVGSTGRSSGPHLHYEIQAKGQSVNPRGYLWD
jgi:murein DD-endopeptidase MepM/ murein hydrolase activator NlpD